MPLAKSTRTFCPLLIGFGLFAASGCDIPREEFRLAEEPFYTLPGRIYSPAPEGMWSTRPPAPAPASVVDPYSPWDSLGELSGYYRLTAERLSSDCTSGPDVPFIAPPFGPYYVDDEGHRIPPEAQLWDDTYFGYLTQRGDALSFEVGEGIVFATYSARKRALADVERVGAAGVTDYLDGFDVDLPEAGEIDVRISGESDWIFHDDYYAVGEVCKGRTRWEAVRRRAGPKEAEYRDFQVVLRWPAASRADLDLIVSSPSRIPNFGENDRHADFARAAGNCYTIHSVGYSPDHDGFVARLKATRLPYHEEVIRCTGAPYGDWRLLVINWSNDEVADYQIETFSGAGVNTGEPTERSFGALGWTVQPNEQTEHRFQLTPPDHSGGAGLITTLFRVRPRPVLRPRGPLTDTYLEFNKAAWQGLQYWDFLVLHGLQEGFVAPNVFPPLAGPIEVNIDITPGGDARGNNPMSRDVVSVAILGSATFDVAQIEAATLKFGPLGASALHKRGVRARGRNVSNSPWRSQRMPHQSLRKHSRGKARNADVADRHLEDANSDGFADLVTRYRAQETGIAFGDTDACIAGQLRDGSSFEGCGDI